ncbi:xylulokinase [Mesorhizobium sp. M4B.F.Ca.ET.215.01.1.1]|uniref:xylulokinase n=4 Tax=Mesorhizobium TaxID=68287 RepID=UPI000FD56B90|nr:MULTISPECIES: xylulokinase [unclassified Mesorhizobium]RUW21680.1 xylulokinase [Mesorhizobium sp. M4B.F.Ca.ET.013.02.1.1]RWF62096.1 MAG: xylulokinase [Mesorhizobium sp.]TGQ15494.1 xylulokinase [Mesorhizobium sp. M4B.F.Ca.ET.215.01.1.1]TGQ45604.1 xylulokinase [Mesorhizobium sp. M4B.F.Ca.ET.214.01.1.1]TGQ48296.1 xylulokinase [Mesorhizobium sp. M00.F.Ca.ET.220.01.1.1]
MYLGLDLGTSGVKALLIDAGQTVIGSGHGSLDVSRPHPGWSEQDPAHWIAACETAIAELKAAHPKELAAVKGIGLSGQMHGATLLDAGDKVLRPCILWNDTRSHVEAAALDADPRFRKLTGNIVFPGFTAPKLAWVKNNEPRIFANVAKVLLPKDFLRLWLTGEQISEMSDSAGTSWLDVGRRRWSADLLAATSLDEKHMPSLVEGTAKAGALRAELAARWGVAAGIPIAGGAGDNAASACGMGTVGAGHAFVSLGTSGVLFAANAAYLPNPASAVHTFCHALPDTWHQMGVILSATDSLNWLSEITGKSAGELTTELGDTLKAPTGVSFLPYLSGERTPHNDSAIRGSFTGLAHESGRAVLTQAVLEGVAFAFRDSLEALKTAGTTLTRVTAIGGGSRSRYWLKAIATALQVPVDIPADGDFGAAFGAARLGLVAATGADPLAVCTAPATDATIDPDGGLGGAFADAYQRYRALYPAIRAATA